VHLKLWSPYIFSIFEDLHINSKAFKK